MKKTAIVLCLILGVFFAFTFCGCGESSVIDFTCFNTQVYITVNGEKITAETESEIKNKFSSLENSLSVTKSGEIASINSAAANLPVKLGDDAFSVFNLSKSLYDFTNGYFNPAVLPISRLWKLSSDTYDRKTVITVPPAAEEIAALIPLADFNLFDVDGKTVYKTVDDAKIDLGGIAKGYAVDAAKDILLSSGVKEGYINVGGSSLYVFSVKENLGVKHPRKNGKQIITVDNSLICGSPLSTSGDYVRYYTGTDGTRYSHVINGFTGRPANTGLSSVTVIAGKDAPESLRSAAATDALSTAIMLMEKQQAINFIKEKLVGFYVFIVNTDEKEIISNTQLFTLLDEDYSRTVI
ncbi:MAG: FAD:protein FMN transferase [Clostridia bacterium]|nr:FAD:protein FMN transferase [Clostridia bacterium]